MSTFLFKMSVAVLLSQIIILLNLSGEFACGNNKKRTPTKVPKFVQKEVIIKFKKRSVYILRKQLTYDVWRTVCS